ncbi:MYG1 family protein [Massilia sp. CFBP9012]|uniref:MYG1 family protein n=1 Tax=Massilia sp. CFBP9012 TaxID=3096531 RepID=UPI002A6B6266|nr:MYG1 family protein [Massilia sp. CFBP9012]MDY0977374.1 MYG1 family protein [Massilia sp. CFBP9012]
MLIATHGGKFHADDAWAVAVLKVLFPEADIVRTREQARIDAADFAIDVGGVWDPATGRFDHHQKEFDATRVSGVPYASAGLVWRDYGARCVAALAERQTGERLTDDTAQQIAYAIDADIVQYLDLSDVGVAKNAPGSYGLSAVVSGFNPGWLDEQRLGYGEAVEVYRMGQFMRAVEFLTDIMGNAVRYRVGAMLAVTQVRQAEVLEDGKLLFLKNAALPWSSVVRKEMPKILFVISHSLTEQRYMLHTVSVDTESFDARADLPEAWAGLREAELAAVTGVEDAVFCHTGRFIAAARSYAGALTMARQALAAVEAGA